MKKPGTLLAAMLALGMSLGPAFAQSQMHYNYTQVNLPNSASLAYPNGIVNPQGMVYNAGTVYRAVQTPAQVLQQLESANTVPAQINPRVLVENSTTLNAYTNGSDIVVTKALLDRLTTNDERAFVIGHELSHILLNHISKTQVRTVGLSLLDRVLGRYIPQGTLGGTLTDLAAQWGINLYQLKSARSYEYQADDLGIQLMAKAGYNPQAAMDVFHILEASTGGSRVPEFLQNHPLDESRIRALAQKYKLSMH